MNGEFENGTGFWKQIFLEIYTPKYLIGLFCGAGCRPVYSNIHSLTFDTMAFHEPLFLNELRFRGG
jgi:hypothetical protein